MHGNSAALIIGFSIQGLAVARSLSKLEIPVYALVHSGTKSKTWLKHPVYYTQHATFLYCDNLRGDAIVDSLLSVRAQIAAETVVLYALTDDSVASVARNWDRLQDSFTVSWRNCSDRILHVLNKSKVPELCAAAGVNYPRTTVISNTDNLTKQLQAMTVPLLIKPAQQNFSFKVQRAESLPEAARFIEGHVDSLPLIVQEWIEGTDKDLLSYTCFVDNSKEVFGFASRKVRSSPPSLGIATIFETADDNDVRLEARKMLASLRLTGPVAIEFKRDPDGVLWFIEANVGRVEYCVDLAIQSGFNLPHADFCCAIGKSMPRFEDSVECRWFDTDKEPFCYWAFCLRQLASSESYRRPVFPYRGQERMVVRVVAVAEALTKLSGRFGRKVAALIPR